MKTSASCFALVLTLGGVLALQTPRPAPASALLTPTTGVSQALTPKKLDISIDIHGAFAQTTVTTVYANPNWSQIEADFMYSAPPGSVVTGFAYWYQGEKVPAVVTEKARAARIYQYIITPVRDPALVEMVGKNSFRARIFPVEARSDLKIEIKLAQALIATSKGLVWNHPLREETAIAPLEKFTLHARTDRSVSNGALESNLGMPAGGKLVVEMSNFKASGDLRLTLPEPAAPLRARLFAARDSGQDGFFALALTPQSATVGLPRIWGVKVYDVLYPSAKAVKAGETVYMYGRYRGAGWAQVVLGAHKATVTFGSQRQQGNVASALWGANQIEALSTNEKNRARVMALSMRYAVPSKWTSWLAIPTAERAAFKWGMIDSDRNAAAKEYAQAIARGDRREARAKKLLVGRLSKQLQAIGYYGSFEKESLLLTNYLDEELIDVRRAVLEASYVGATNAQMRQGNGGPPTYAAPAPVGPRIRISRLTTRCAWCRDCSPLRWKLDGTSKPAPRLSTGGSPSWATQVLPKKMVGRETALFRNNSIHALNRWQWRSRPVNCRPH